MIRSHGHSERWNTGCGVPVAEFFFKYRQPTWTDMTKMNSWTVREQHCTACVCVFLIATTKMMMMMM